jgi:glycosyltransferase involved in cell wall biosynthesis
VVAGRGTLASVTAEVVLIIPMLTRPHRVDPVIGSIQSATTVDHTILFVCTEGDQDVIDAVEAHSDVRLSVIPPNQRGDYAIKINHGYSITDEPFLFLGADDLRFHRGWYEAARRHFNRRDIGVVGTQDKANRRVRQGRHATHSLVSREYVDVCGTIDESRKVLHEGYLHEFVDDEFVETAKKRKAFAFEHRSVVEHLHPTVGKAQWDPMYKAQTQRMRADRRVFMERRKLWL